jgi:hypothetical protein
MLYLGASRTSQVVEHLPSNHKALSSSPSTAKKKKKKKEKKRKKERKYCSQEEIHFLVSLGQKFSVESLELLKVEL